jgi:hypothetical protein
VIPDEAAGVDSWSIGSVTFAGHTWTRCEVDGAIEYVEEGKEQA